MNSLKQLFPSLRIETSPSDDAALLSFYIMGDWYIIPEKDLTRREIEILRTLSDKPEQHSRWYRILCGYETLVSASPLHYQYLHVQISGLEFATLYLETLTSFFENAEASFYLNPRYAVLVLKDHCLLDPQQLIDILSSLDHDFSCKSYAFLGGIYTLDAKISLYFNEEVTLFKNKQHSTPVSTLSQSLLYNYVKPALEQSEIVRHFAQFLRNDPETIQLVQTLWTFQGNLSQTAQALFIHRNTLTYRIDRFFVTTGLSLRNLDELLMCYIVTLLD